MKNFESLKKLVNSGANFIYDKKFGIETRKVVELNQLGLSLDHSKNSSRYDGTPYLFLNQLFCDGNYSLKGKSLLDIGSGKGRILFYALSKGASRVTGIEASPILNQLFQENLSSCSVDGQIKMIQSNATEFKGPWDYDYIFLYHPFGDETINVIIDSIKSSYLNQKLRILYVNPVFGTTFEKNDFLLEKKIYSKACGLFCHVYTN